MIVERLPLSCGPAFIGTPEELEINPRRGPSSLAVAPGALQLHQFVTEDEGMSDDSDFEVISRLWQEFWVAPFPARLRGVELAGQDMVLLDADLAGCVSTWVNNGGELDAWRLGILGECLTALEEALPQITDAEGLDYYRRLHHMSRLTLMATPQATG